MIPTSWAPIKQTDGKPLISTSGEVLEGTSSKISVQDTNSELLLSSVLKQLKIMNLHLATLTDNIFTREDVE